MSPFRTLSAALTLGIASGIHAVAAGGHFRQWPASGVFFIVAAVVQAVCAYLVLRGTTHRTARVAVGISLVLIALWAVSRTIGMPFGPQAGVQEPVGALDLVATLAELASIVALLGRRSARDATTAVPVISRVLAATVVVGVVGLGTASAGALPSHEHGAERPSHSHEH